MEMLAVPSKKDCLKGSGSGGRGQFFPLLPFLLPACNLEVMAGAPAAILDHEDQLGNGNHTWWSNKT